MTDALFPAHACPCTGKPPCWICATHCGHGILLTDDCDLCNRGIPGPLATCPDHPTIPRADCVCAYPGEESHA